MLARKLELHLEVGKTNLFDKRWRFSCVSFVTKRESIYFCASVTRETFLFKEKWRQQKLEKEREKAKRGMGA